MVMTSFEIFIFFVTLNNYLCIFNKLIIQDLYTVGFYFPLDRYTLLRRSGEFLLDFLK